jgi:hypothetical protein
MPYKLAIGNVIGVKMKGTTRDENGAEKRFEFTLVCNRVGNEELRKLLTSRESVTAESFFEKNATNWRGQELVQDEEGRPAPFSAEALAVLFTIEGMASMCWQAYLDQVVAVAKN